MYSKRTPLFLVHVHLVLAAIAAAGCLAPDAVQGGGGNGTGGSAPTGGGGTGGEAGSGGEPTLHLAWARSYGIDADADQRAWSISATPGRDAVVAGEYRGSLTIGDLPILPNTEGRDAFVAQLDPGGEPSWVMGVAGVGEQRVYRAAAAPEGGFVVAGAFTQSLTFAGEPQAPAPDDEDGFVASIDDQQNVRWVVPLLGPEEQTVHALAVSPEGDVVIAGLFDDTLQIGPLTVDGETLRQDFFVARLDKTGEPLWATSLGGDPAALPPGQPTCHLALLADGSVVVAGTFMGTVRLDENLGAVGQRDVFIAKLDPDGAPIWGHTFGAPDRQQRASSLAVDAQGHVLLAGDLTGKATLEGTTLASEGDEPDAFLALFDEAGSLTWARRYGSVAQDHADAVTFDQNGDILFAGRFRGAITFGEEAPLLGHVSIGPDDDIYLAKLTPDGAPLLSRAYGKNGNQVPTHVTVDTQNAILLTGYFDGTVDFGDGDLDALAGDDLFAVKLEQ